MLVDFRLDRSLHLRSCLIGALLAKDQFSCPRSILQQCVLYSGPFLESPSLGFFLEQTDSGEVPIVAPRKPWMHDRAQMACRIPKTGWHDSM
jgi:hypothetical protein